MFLSKVKTAAVLLLALGLLGTGAGLYRARSAPGATAALVPVNPAPETETKVDDEPKASEPVEKDGLSVTVRPTRARFAANETPAFVVTFKNTSDKDFTLLHTPKNYLDWKFRCEPQPAGDGMWQATNTAKREGFSSEPAVLKAGQSLRVTAAVDEGFLFKWLGEQARTPRRSLPPGKYQLTIALTCHGATKVEGLDKLPPLWVGEVVTKPVAFEVLPVEKATSKAVRVTGAEFVAVADKTWRQPAAGESRGIDIDLRITNTTDKDLTFRVWVSPTVQLTTAEGKALQRGYARDGTAPVKLVRVAAGKTYTVSRAASLSWAEDGKTLTLHGGDNSAGAWTYRDLVPGKYTLTLTYENETKGDDVWVGKAVTEAVQVEIPTAEAPGR